MAGDIDPVIFGNRMKRERERKGWTILKLSQESGVASGWISQVENGKGSGISLDTARKIARALRMSLDYLAGTFDDIERVPAGMGELGGYAIPAR